MEIILLHDVTKLGQRGESMKVSDGYARNFLFPQGLAVQADAARKREIEMRLASLEAKDGRAKSGAASAGKALEGAVVKLSAKASDEDKLFGSVTSHMIAASLVEGGHEIDARQVELEEPLRSLGHYKVPVRLHRDVCVEVQVEIERA